MFYNNYTLVTIKSLLGESTPTVERHDIGFEHKRVVLMDIGVTTILTISHSIHDDIKNVTLSINPGLETFDTVIVRPAEEGEASELEVQWNINNVNDFGLDVRSSGLRYICSPFLLPIPLLALFILLDLYIVSK